MTIATFGMFFPLYTKVAWLTKVVWLTPRKTAFSTPFFFFFFCSARTGITLRRLVEGFWIQGADYVATLTESNLLKPRKHFSLLFCAVWLLPDFSAGCAVPSCPLLALHGHFSALPISACSLAVLLVLASSLHPVADFIVLAGLAVRWLKAVMRLVGGIQFLLWHWCSFYFIGKKKKNYYF